MRVEIRNDNLKSSLLLFKFESFVRAASFVIIFLAIVLGVSKLNLGLSLFILIFAGAYQFLRIYFYIWGTLRWRSKAQSFSSFNEVMNPPMISIVVPCYNEGKLIAHCLQSLTQLNYRSFEIIVVDDGSTDDSLEQIHKVAQQHQSLIQVVSKLNSGKSNSLNVGIAHAQGEFILCIDADCEITPNSLVRGVRHLLADSAVAAVAGTVRVANDDTFLTAYQELEYGLGDLQKACLANFGTVNVVPGPVGLFRKSALAAVGGYEEVNTTFAEDTELTLRLISSGWKVVFEPEMCSFTESPSTIQALTRQRYRWSRGIYQALRKNFYNLAETKKVFLAYLLLEKIWAPIMDFGILVFFAVQFVAYAKIELLLYYTLLIVVTEYLQLFVVGWTSRRPIIKNILPLMLSRFSLSIVIIAWKYLCLLEEWGRVAMTWDKLQRMGRAKPLEQEEMACS